MARSSHLAVEGHNLQRAGDPYDRAAAPIIAGRIGRALCQCGATSESFSSTAERRRWHFTHKNKIRTYQKAADRRAQYAKHESR